MDRRIVKTREAISKAYLDLIIEKGTSQISISELARRANIDRKTFYLHYSSLDDVLSEYVENQFNRVVSLMEKNHYCNNPFDVGMLVELLNRFYTEEEKMLLAIAGGDSYDDLWRKIHDILADKVKNLYASHVNMDAAEMNVYYDFFTAGVIDVYRRWSRGEYSYDLRHLIEMIGEVVRAGLVNRGTGDGSLSLPGEDR
jgi:AcrR family transcriptional regulator